MNCGGAHAPRPVIAQTDSPRSGISPSWLIWSVCSSASAISIAAADSEPNTAANWAKPSPSSATPSWSRALSNLAHSFSGPMRLPGSSSAASRSPRAPG